MSHDELLALFAGAAGAQHDVIAALTGQARRERTMRPGQYALDVAADAAVRVVLARAEVRVVSEESGTTGPEHAAVVVVVDPVDGSTNCAREIPYWGISLCAIDADGLLCALVENGATGERSTAIRGMGAWQGTARLTPSTNQRLEDAVVAVSGSPHPVPRWRQYRALGSTALALCDVAAGRLDAFVDCVPDAEGPWDYLGGLLVCREAGAHVVDRLDRELVVCDPTARRQVVAAATPELLEAVRASTETP